MRGLTIEAFGDGEQVVDMIFSRDLGRITVGFTNGTQSVAPQDCERSIGLTVNDIAHAVNSYFDNSAGMHHLLMYSPCKSY